MFRVIHTNGSCESDPSIESLSSLYDELLEADQEHGDVSVADEQGWSVSAHRDGRVIFEHLEEGGEQHMIPVDKALVLQIWEELVRGDLESVRRHPWRPGYG